MEKNWLIRTSQKQILGPVVKQKILELIEKGALGPMDEVASGNGYWFSLKEKALVEKYLYGETPQSFNPVSESISNLGKEDAEESSDITVIKNMSLASLPLDSHPVKLPNPADLEFPDVEKITLMVGGSVDGEQISSPPIKNKIESPLPKQTIDEFNLPALDLPALDLEEEHSAEKMVLPSEDDLSFPDIDDHKTSPKVKKGKVDLSQQYTRTVALDNLQAAEVLPDISPIATKHEISKKEVREVREVKEVKEVKEMETVPLSSVATKKKTKASILKHPATQRDPTREVSYKAPSESLKKRNDNYLIFILIVLVLIIFSIFFYFKEILNKPLPV